MERDSLYSRSIALLGLPEFIESLGGSPDKLFAQAGLNLAHINGDENFVSWNGTCRLLELAARELDEPSFGIKWAHSMPKSYQNTGPMLFLGSLVADMQEFFDLAFKYQKIHTNGVRYAVLENKAEGWLEGQLHVHPNSVPCRQYAEHIIAVAVLMEKHHLGEAKLKQVRFQHSAPADLRWHKLTFPCPVIFNSDVTAGRMELEFLHRAVNGKFKYLQPLLKLHLNRRMKKVPDRHSSIVSLVQELLPAILGVNNSGITRVADMMEISSKKLQRLLKEEDVTYSEVIDGVRQGMSRRLLFESAIPIARIALLLDYSTSEAYNAACKRWTGMSPRRYRQHLRNQTAAE